MRARARACLHCGSAGAHQVLLVALAVAAVLEQHVRVARLNLRLQDGKPQLLRAHDAPRAPLLLIAARDGWRRWRHRGRCGRQGRAGRMRVSKRPHCWQAAVSSRAAVNAHACSQERAARSQQPQASRHAAAALHARQPRGPHHTTADTTEQAARCSAAPPHAPAVQRLKLGAPHVCQPRRLVGAEEAPLAVGLDARHEQVVDPEAVEQVARARLLLAVVLAQVQPLKDVRVPRLQVHGKGTLALAAALGGAGQRAGERGRETGSERGSGVRERAQRPR